MDSRVITFSASVENAFVEKVEHHNSTTPVEFNTTVDIVKKVYRRGAHSYSSTRHFGLTRSELAMERVDAFLSLLKIGYSKNPMYTYDNDLLPQEHKRALTASAKPEDTLTVVLKESYSNPEEAILVVTEYMGFGYEAEPAVRAAWIRAVNNDESPYQRVLDMAQYTFESKDADLLPRPEKGVSP